MSPAKHLETVARALAHVSATCVGHAWRGEAVQQLPQGVAKAAGRLELVEQRLAGRLRLLLARASHGK